MGPNNALAKTTRPSTGSVLPRERLYAALDDRRRTSMVWLQGPPGCGKTALVSSYIEARGSNCLWYQVDAGDGDPAALFLYLAKAGFQGTADLPLFTAEYQAQPEAFARRYFRSLFESIATPFVLVFDNYQELGEGTAVHPLLRQAAAELPAEGCMMVLSRNEPAPDFIRLRANRNLELLGWSDLRLTRDESDAIALQANGAFTSQDLEQLYTNTEGWAAGLILTLEQLRAMGLSRLPAAAAAQPLLFDYLAGEVFAGLNPNLQSLLLKTACVSEMSEQVAKTLSGDPRAGETLAMLHRQNDLVSLKPGINGPVYQCHPLMREFLRARARQAFSAEEYARLLHSAVRELETEGSVDAAIRLLVEAGDHQRLLKAILDRAGAMLSQGRALTLEGWLLALPEALRHENPWVAYWLAACRYQHSPLRAGAAYEQAVSLFESHRPADRQGLILACAGAMDSVLYVLDDLSVLDRWIALAEQLCGQDFEVPWPEARARIAASMFIALVFRQPQHPHIGTWARRAMDQVDAIPDPHSRMAVQMWVAVKLNYSGQFDAAYELLEQLRTLCKASNTSPLAELTVKNVESLYFMLTAETEHCLRAVYDGIEIGRESGVQLWDYHLLSNGVAGALASGDLGSADELLADMAAFGGLIRRLDRSRFHYFRAWRAMLGAQLDEACQQAATALRLAEEVGCPYFEAHCRLALSQVLVACGEADKTTDDLRQVLQLTRQIKNSLLEFMSLLTFSDMALATGRPAIGLSTLKRGLEVGREKGFRHFLWWQPRMMSRLCNRALQEGIETDYVRSLIRDRGLRPVAMSEVAVQWPWDFRIHAFGEFEIVHGNTALTEPGRSSVRPMVLLKTLISLGARKVPEHTLASCLWPRIDAQYAQRSLTTTLHRLRKWLGEDQALILRHGRLSLNPDRCWLDVQAFDAVVTRIENLLTTSTDAPGAVPGELLGLAEQLLSLYRGPFMAGEENLEVILACREQYRNRFLRALGDIAHGLEQGGQQELAIGLYRRGLQADPLAEGLYRRLMLIYRNRSRIEEALEIYSACKLALQNGLNTPPGPETEAIHRALLASL